MVCLKTQNFVDDSLSNNGVTVKCAVVVYVVDAAWGTEVMYAGEDVIKTASSFASLYFSRSIRRSSRITEP